jgi:hypothetical protein
MRKIILTSSLIFSVSILFTVLFFYDNTNFQESTLRSVDNGDSPSRQGIVLHQTEVGNQYVKPIKKSIPNSQWEETHIASTGTISDDRVEKNLSFTTFPEMPTPSNKVLDRFEEKSKNPKPRKVPLMENPENEINPSIDGAINIDEFLDVEKKN